MLLLSHLSKLAEKQDGENRDRQGMLLALMPTFDIRKFHQSCHSFSCMILKLEWQNLGQTTIFRLSSCSVCDKPSYVAKCQRTKELLANIHYAGFGSGVAPATAPPIALACSSVISLPPSIPGICTRTSRRAN